MALTSLDQLVSALASAPLFSVYKASIPSTAAGQYHSFWRSIGFPGRGEIPTSPEVCTNETLGSLPLPSKLAGNLLYFAKIGVAVTTTVTLQLVDRLVQNGGLSGVNTLTQPVNLDLTTVSSQNRCHPSGSDVFWCLEWYADTGATATTVTVDYTDNNNIIQNSTITLAASRRATFLQPILPVGNHSIKSVNSVTLSTSTGSVGNFGVTAYKILATLSCSLPNVAVLADYASLGLPQISDFSCLSFIAIATSTSIGTLIGDFSIVQG